MKSRCLSLVLLLLAASTHAQRFKQNVSFGPIVGLGHAWMSGIEGDKEFKLAPSIGATFVYSAGAHWGLGFDVKYSREGVKTEGLDFNLKSTLNANYIRIPVKAMYFLGQLGDKVRPKIMAGPTLGFLVGGKQKVKTTSDEMFLERSTKDALHTFDLGLQGGIGLNFRLTRNTWLNTDVSYYHGFRNVAKASGEDWKNRNIAANVGVAFGIGTIREKK
ncbi:MAG: porin family protein [Chitinophagaceae bacterium]